jgi:orotate phosphoribosyltransferase
VLRGEFTLRSGRKSNYYLDKYLFETQPDVLAALGSSRRARDAGRDADRRRRARRRRARRRHAMACGKPFVIIRNQKKDYGTSKLVEGKIDKGDRVLVVEDVLTTGGQVIEAAKSIEGVDAKVVKIVSVIDRWKAPGKTSSLPVHVRSLFTTKDLAWRRIGQFQNGNLLQRCGAGHALAPKRRPHLGLSAIDVTRPHSTQAMVRHIVYGTQQSPTSPLLARGCRPDVRAAEPRPSVQASTARPRFIYELEITKPAAKLFDPMIEIAKTLPDPILNSVTCTIVTRSDRGNRDGRSPELPGEGAGFGRPTTTMPPSPCGFRGTEALILTLRMPKFSRCTQSLLPA